MNATTRSPEQHARELLRNDDPRAHEIFSLMTDAIYLAQVPSLEDAVMYAKEVNAQTISPVSIDGLSTYEARPFFNIAARPQWQKSNRNRAANR